MGAESQGFLLLVDLKGVLYVYHENTTRVVNQYLLPHTPWSVTVHLVGHVWPLEDAGPSTLALGAAVRGTCTCELRGLQGQHEAGGRSGQTPLTAHSSHSSSPAHKQREDVFRVNKPHIMLPELFDISTALKCERPSLCPDSHVP